MLTNLFFRIIKEILRDEESLQDSSADSVECDDDDYQQTNIQTKLQNSKLKIMQLDRIITRLRKLNNRQRKSIHSLEQSLTELKDKLHTSNKELDSLKDPDFEFS